VGGFPRPYDALWVLEPLEGALYKGYVTLKELGPRVTVCVRE